MIIPPEDSRGRWASDLPFMQWSQDMGCYDVPPADEAWHFMTGYSLWGCIA